MSLGLSVLVIAKGAARPYHTHTHTHECQSPVHTLGTHAVHVHVVGRRLVINKHNTTSKVTVGDASDHSGAWRNVYDTWKSLGYLQTGVCAIPVHLCYQGQQSVTSPSDTLLAKSTFVGHSYIQLCPSDTMKGVFKEA